MIIGSGLLAREFHKEFFESENVCIYAAGVSNSACTEIEQFKLEKTRLLEALEGTREFDAFVYFGTCSIYDPEARNTSYVQHKLAMEKIVSFHPKNLIVRLPQVAGNTPNPHTLLNFLHDRITKRNKFYLWRNAMRNVIDVADVVSITRQLVTDPMIRNIVVNVANLINYSMLEIVQAMERVTGATALYEMEERGSQYSINTALMNNVLPQCDVSFDSRYLDRVLAKYYRKA